MCPHKQEASLRWCFQACNLYHGHQLSSFLAISVLLQWSHKEVNIIARLETMHGPKNVRHPLPINKADLAILLLIPNRTQFFGEDKAPFYITGGRNPSFF